MIAIIKKPKLSIKEICQKELDMKHENTDQWACAVWHLTKLLVNIQYQMWNNNDDKKVIKFF